MVGYVNSLEGIFRCKLLLVQGVYPQYPSVHLMGENSKGVHQSLCSCRHQQRQTPRRMTQKWEGKVRCWWKVIWWKWKCEFAWFFSAEYDRYRKKAGVAALVDMGWCRQTRIQYFPCATEDARSTDHDLGKKTNSSWINRMDFSPTFQPVLLNKSHQSASFFSHLVVSGYVAIRNRALPW